MSQENLSDLFTRFINEPDQEKRNTLIDTLTEEQAKDLLKAMGDFKHRPDLP